MRALIVDDERMTRETLVGFVPWRALGVDEVCEARDGLDALEVVRARPPDLVLCDVRMPRLDGIGFAEKLRELDPECRLLFLSGHSDKPYLKAAIRLGAADYLEKPIRVPEISEAVARNVRLVRERAAARARLAPVPPAAAAEPPAGGGGATERRLARVDAYVHEHLADPDLSLEAIAEHAGLSESYLCNLYKGARGETVKDAVTRLRVERARELLGRGEEKLQAVALAVGFRDPSWFATVFKRATGLTPSEYRERVRR